MALGDYDFIAAYFERLCATVAVPIIVAGADTRIGRAVCPGFLAHAARVEAIERCAAAGRIICEHLVYLGTVRYHGPGCGPRDRARVRSDGNAEDSHTVG